MKRLGNLYWRHERLATVLLVAVTGSVSSSAQTRVSESPKSAIEVTQSRAQREAEQLVSLSAEQITSILRKETGLLLQVKKLLVRKAYEQGRILDPQDLTDDALFRLVREDVNIRVLITREIEDRYYVRAKPSGQEQDVVARQERELLRTETQTREQSSLREQARVSQSREDAYWSQHAQPPPRGAEQYPVPSHTRPEYQPPEQQPERQTPQNPPGSDPRRQVEQADNELPIDDLYDRWTADTSGMTYVRPEQLAGLLDASAIDRFPRAGKDPDRMGTRDLSPFSLPGWSGEGELPQGGATKLPQQASVDMKTRSRLPPYPVQPREDDHPVVRHRANPYADIPSLYDLYSQYTRRSPKLERFGEEVFRSGTGNLDELPMDMPVGPDYVLGPGDGLSIDLWGGVSQRLQRVVDREGRVALPEAGAVQVTGRTLGDVQHLVQNVLRTQFRDVEADVSLSRIRTVRVYVVGDVERPGAYDVSSLSTPLNALYLAGGPTSQGSLRVLRHYRGKQLVQEVDVYELLLHGVRSGVQRLEAGDTILIPPLGPEITIEGMVRRPAVYEVQGEKSLSEMLEVAGGVLPSGTLRHIDVERVEAHQSRTMLRLDIPENNNREAVDRVLDDFKVQDGDKIKISPILPYADKTVYLDGHVSRPGKFAYRDNMKVTDLIKSYNDLLPEPYKRHAEIIRLTPPDYTPVVLSFSLENALAGKEQDVALKPFDTVRVFGRYDFEDPPVITVTGQVRDPGDHITNGTTYLRDAVYLAGGTTPDALLSDAQVFRKTEDGKLKVISVNLGKALAGEEGNNILLQHKDRVFIYENLIKLDPPTVMIQGEVAQPGKYPLGEDMTTAGLVRVAGGLKRGAYTQTADLTRYAVENGQRVVGEHITVQIAAALSGQPDTDVRLRDGDVLTIGQLAGWKDVGATVTLSGEVLHPGTYGIQEGERLSSIVARAGGFRADAYPYGAVFERVQVREIEERHRFELIREVQDQGTTLKLVPETDQDQKAAKEASLMQWEATLQALKDTPPAGRLVIHISADVKRWANTSADMPVRGGDRIHIPKAPNVVIVNGAVYNPTAISFKPGKSAGWYLSQAGGPTNVANKKATFVIRADGSVIGGSRGMFSGGVEDAAAQPGDVVVVPEKAFSANTRWRNTLQVAQLVSAVGIAVQVARGF